MLRQSTPKKKAAKAKKKASKTTAKAAKRAGKAGAAAQDRAADLAERAGAVAHDRAAELAEYLRESEALAKAQERGSDLAELAREKWREAEIEQRAAELAERVRDSDPAQRAAKRTKAYTESGLAALGAWLASGPASERLGVQKRRRWPLWLAGLIGAAVGFAAGKMVSGGGGMPTSRDDLAASAERFSARTDSPGVTALADTVRTTLSGDPRTAQLRELNINVAEGTVFVRGTVPKEIDQSAIREVISGVPGVEDVDLQLTPVG